jgi:hypothetical protein
MRGEHRPEPLRPNPQELLISDAIAQIAKPCQYRGASMDFLGNISLRLVGLLVTVGTLAAVYFFVIRPATDTANNAFDSISQPLRQAERQAARAQNQLQHDVKSGDSGSKVDLNRLQKCVSKGHHDVALLQRCARRFGP